jgi:hypothetical protein
VRWENDDAITQDKLRMRDYVIAYDGVNFVDDISVFNAVWVRNVAKRTSLKF